MSKRSTLQAKDAQARTGETIKRSSSIFPKEVYVRKEGYEAKYDELLIQNRLLFTLDLVKERVSLAYTRTDEAWMADDITMDHGYLQSIREQSPSVVQQVSWQSL